MQQLQLPSQPTRPPPRRRTRSPVGQPIRTKMREASRQQREPSRQPSRARSRMPTENCGEGPTDGAHEVPVPQTPSPEKASDMELKRARTLSPVAQPAITSMSMDAPATGSDKAIMVQPTKRKEVHLKDLDAGQREMFEMAKAKEWAGIQNAEVVISHSGAKAKALRQEFFAGRTMPSRHLFVWKKDPSAPNGFFAKARWVALGHRDPDLAELETFSPMVSREGWLCALQTICNKRWGLQLADVSTVFMQGKWTRRPKGRRFCEAPREFQGS